MSAGAGWPDWAWMTLLVATGVAISILSKLKDRLMEVTARLDEKLRSMEA